MFPCNETGTLYACVGQRGGKPAYAGRGVAFSCRSEPAWGERARNTAISRMADTRIFIPVAPGGEIAPRPGDRIELDGRSYRVAEVQPLRAWKGLHHLELLAKEQF